MLPNAQPRPRPRLLEQRDKQRDLRKEDEKQKAICRKRSGGQCEVLTAWGVLDTSFGRVRSVWDRCLHRATENHHLIGGSGRRNKGKSILAAHRLHVCAACHKDITGRVLVPCVEQAKAECAATVRYERVR